MSTFVNPWDLIEEHGTRKIKLVPDMDYLFMNENDSEGAFQIGCTAESLNRDPIDLDGEHRYIWLHDLKVVAELGTYRSRRTRTLLQHMRDKLTEPIELALTELEFELSPGQLTWRKHGHFDPRIEHHGHPKISIEHPDMHEDFYIHWKSFFEPSSEYIPIIETSWDEYSKRQKVQQAK